MAGGIDKSLTTVHGPHHGNLNFLHIRRQECQCCQGRRSDGKALARGGCRVAQRIELIGTSAHLFAQFTHLRIATCIVGYRAVGIGSQRDTQRREHAHCRNADAIESSGDAGRAHAHVEAIGAEIAQDDGHRDGDHGDAGGDHSSAYTFYYYRCRTGL